MQGAALGGVGAATGLPASRPRQAVGRRLAFAGFHGFLVGGFLMLELFPGELLVQVHLAHSSISTWHLWLCRPGVSQSINPFYRLYRNACMALCIAHGNLCRWFSGTDAGS